MTTNTYDSILKQSSYTEILPICFEIKSYLTVSFRKKLEKKMFTLTLQSLYWVELGTSRDSCFNYWEWVCNSSNLDQHKK